MTIDQRRVLTNGISLNVACAGPDDGALIVLLHGFPEFWYSWRKQIPALAAAGFRVMAPDMRGYNLSDKPAGVGAYRADQVAADVAGLIASTGRERAVVVGHDWGGAVAWSVGMRHPERVERLVIINCPHPAAMMRRVRRDMRQLRRSWYIVAFQLPWFPERMMRIANFRALTQALVGSSRPGTFTKSDLARYREAWSQPGALTAMVNYYRAALQRAAPPAPTRIDRPVHIIWGVADAFLGRALAEDSRYYCADARVTYIDGATHWVHEEEAERVTALIINS